MPERKNYEDLRLIGRKELLNMIPYSYQHILRLEKQGKFPKRVRVGSGRVAWSKAEVEEWIVNRLAERD